MMDERTGEAYLGSEHLTVVGRQLRPGDQAPDFVLDTLATPEGAVQAVSLADSAGTVRLLNLVISLDTPVCHAETRQWERLRAELPPNIAVYTVSMDLPWAQARWRQAEGIAHPALSAHRDERFGRDYGALLKEWRLLQRAVVVIDRANRVRHAEYVADQVSEPDYAAAVLAARRAAEG